MGCIPIKRHTEVGFISDASEESQIRNYNHIDNLLYTINEECSIFEHSDRIFDLDNYDNS